MSTTIDNIVVGVDGSPGAARALEWAAAEADLHGSALTAVMAWGFLDQHLDHFDPKYDQSAADATLRRFVTDALGEDRATAVATQAVNDLPARTMLEAGAAADLVVVGARGLGGFKGLLLGSVSQHCLQHSRTPVAVIKDPATAPSEERTGIVVAVDGSPTADRALAWAAEEARRRKTNLDVLHAWQLPAVGYSPHVAITLDRQVLEDDANRLLATVVERADTSGIAEVRQLVRRGSPAASILDAAAAAELVVLGTRGRGSLKRVLLGSVATQVTAHTTSPVVVVPPVR